ncbi:MAG: hypothetical protein QOK37_1171 [Thermoanaerobaculia bacterium]|jgi:hypothetical protein|nr:hypothetical protein [Thermoanaerobaculia bacterium]
MFLRVRLLSAILVCLAALVVSTPAVAQFNGTWTGTFVHSSPNPPNPTCTQTGPLSMTFTQNGNTVTGSLKATFSKDPDNNCQPMTPVDITFPLSGSVASTVLSGVLSADKQLPFTATFSSGAVFFSAPDNDVWNGTLFRAPSSTPSPADLRGTWNGTHQASVVYCTPDVPLTGTATLVVTSQSGNTIAGTVQLALDKSVNACQLQTTPFSYPSFPMSGSVDGNAFTAKVTLSGNTVGALGGVVNGEGMVFTLTVPRTDPLPAEKGEPIDTIFTGSLTRGAAIPPPSITTFTATPATIVAGDSSVLSWTTQDATSASINNGVNSVPVNGTKTVSPIVTTTYTLTAIGANTSTTTKTATVTVTPCVQPTLTVSSIPIGMLQAVGGTLPTDSFTLTNTGTTPAKITLTQTGSFFTQTPTSFTIAASDSQIVFLVATAQPAGFYAGTSVVSACGVSTGLTIPVYLRVAAIPLTPVTVLSPAGARIDTVFPSTTGTVSFTNPGSSTIEGFVITDVPWITIPVPALSLGAEETKQVQFIIDRSKRPDGAAPIGGVIGLVSFRYVNASSSSAALPGYPSVLTTVPSSAAFSIVTVVVVDSMKGSSINEPIPPLNGQLAFFLTGVSSKTSFGDLTLSNRSSTSSIGDLRMYFGSTNSVSATKSSNVPLFPANSAVLFPSILKSAFDEASRTGTLQFRSTQLGNVSVLQTQINANSGQTSYGTALPVFRSDRAFAPGQNFFLPGVQKSSTMTTTLYVQEVSGKSARYQVDLIDAAGVITIGSTSDLTGFGLAELLDVVPSGRVTLRITNVSDPASGGTINGYALVTDSATGDSFVVAQLTAAPGADPLFAPAFATPSRNLVLHLMNARSDGPINITATTVTASTVPARRRTVKKASIDSPLTPQSTIAIPPIAALSSYQLTIPESGFVKLTGSTSLRVAGRFSIPRSGGSFGSGIPVVSGRGLKLDETVRFAGIEDASPSSVAFARPLTYRTDLMLVETSGQSSMTVKLTLRYVFSTATTSSSTGAVQQVDVPAGGFILISDLGKSLIGPLRLSFGDLHNAVLDVQIIGGTGAVIPFLRATDNGTGDVTIRTEGLE